MSLIEQLSTTQARLVAAVETLSEQVSHSVKQHPVDATGESASAATLPRPCQNSVLKKPEGGGGELDEIRRLPLEAGRGSEESLTSAAVASIDDAFLSPVGSDISESSDGSSEYYSNDSDSEFMDSFAEAQSVAEAPATKCDSPVSMTESAAAAPIFDSSAVVSSQVADRSSLRTSKKKKRRRRKKHLYVIQEEPSA